MPHEKPSLGAFRSARKTHQNGGQETTWVDMYLSLKNGSINHQKSIMVATDISHLNIDIGHNHEKEFVEEVIEGWRNRGIKITENTTITLMGESIGACIEEVAHRLLLADVVKKIRIDRKHSLSLVMSEQPETINYDDYHDENAASVASGFKFSVDKNWTKLYEVEIDDDYITIEKIYRPDGTSLHKTAT